MPLYGCRNTGTVTHFDNESHRSLDIGVKGAFRAFVPLYDELIFSQQTRTLER